MATILRRESAFTQRVQNLAANIMKKRGRPVTYIAYGKSSYDPGTKLATRPKTEQTIMALVYEGNVFRDELKAASDYLVMTAVDVVRIPKLGDEIEFDGDVHEIVQKMPYMTGESVAYHKLFVRRK